MKKLSISIIINCFLLIVSVTLLIRGDYHHKLYAKLELFSKNSVSDEQLLSMNNEKTVSFIDYSQGEGDETINFVIIGNSLATHPISEKIGWNHVSGMAASSIDKDYVHILLNAVHKKNPKAKINFRVANFADFERNPSAFQRNLVDSLVSFNPQIVIFQLGENANKKEDYEIFKNKYIELVELFKQHDNSTKTICTTPFFPSLEKNNLIEAVSIATESYMVDLSSLVLLDDKNYVRNEKNYIGDKSSWKDDGIGIHPGDIGMKNIANRLLIPINILLDK